MDLSDRDANFIQHKQDFAYFLAPDNGESLYGEKVEELVSEGGKRLSVDLNHIAQYNAQLRRSILQAPMEFIPAWEEALQDFVQHRQFMDADTDISAKANQQQQSQIETQQFKIGFCGNFGRQRITPQQLMSDLIGTLVCIEGIVSRASLIRPKVIETVHYCEATQEYHTQSYRDATSILGNPTTSAYPTTDQNGNALTTEFGLCTYMDQQTIHIQDMPERTQAGSMPQTVECILEDDLVDSCKPGDRIQMIGIYRALAGARASGMVSGRFRTVVLVNNVIKIGSSDDNQPSALLTADDIRNIKKQAKTKNVFEMLSSSIVPSIFGHEFIKKAIVLQLLAGCEKNLDNGTHIRGDINILMVGDPSCGKSQLLRGVMNIAPLAINTSGRGSTGVGLTAAVTTDKDSGEKRLEAGAMVLADRGIVCIDEFDKMTDVDRTAIHEVMEQQTVTIAKAGIHTSLNARCSVIAAANPVYGMYDRTRKPHENIGLPDSLLSRFDLLFIVLDKIDTQIDRNISEHVLNMHLTPMTDNMMMIDGFAEFGFNEDFNDDDEEEEDENNNNNNSNRNNNKKSRKKGTEIYSKQRVTDPVTKQRMKLYSIAFCKKYIEFAKKTMRPKLTNSASEEIAQLYAQLRAEERDQTLPITARCLETIIRLSTAHAKLKLRQKISKADVREAMKVLQFALTNDATPSEMDMTSDPLDNNNNNMIDDEDNEDEEEDNNNNNNNNNGKQEMDDSEEEEEEQKMVEMALENSDCNNNNNNRNKKRKRNRKRKRSPAAAGILSPNQRSKKRARIVVETEFNGVLDKKREMSVCRVMSAHFRKSHVGQISIENLLPRVQNNTNEADQAVRNITLAELTFILKHLHEQNKLFLNGNMAHQI